MGWKVWWIGHFPERAKDLRYDRLPIVLALLASYDPDVKGLVNITALVDALREDSSLRELCGFTDLVPSRTTFIRTSQSWNRMGTGNSWRRSSTGRSMIDKQETRILAAG